MKHFKTISQYEDYLINNYGEIYSKKSNKLLKKQYDKRGYQIIVLCKNGVPHTYQVHRLVAEAFIDNPNNYKTINHKDGNHSNNYVGNLEWCTQKENNIHCIQKQLKKTKHILCVETGQVFIDSNEAEKFLGKKPSNNNIYQCCRGRYKTAYGYHWKFIL